MDMKKYGVRVLIILDMYSANIPSMIVVNPVYACPSLFRLRSTVNAAASVRGEFFQIRERALDTATAPPRCEAK